MCRQLSRQHIKKRPAINYRKAPFWEVTNGKNNGKPNTEHLYFITLTVSVKEKHYEKSSIIHSGEQ